MKRAPSPKILAAVCAAAILSACSAFKEHSDYYKSAQEGRPLEVPPDLDSPTMANELVVPPAGGGAATAAAGATAPGTAAAPPGAMVAVGGNELHRAENVQDSWQQVGSVLGRSDLGKLSNRDEAGHAFTFEFDAPMEKPSEGWTDSFKHFLGFGAGKQVRQSLTVFVADDNGGSRIVVTSPVNSPESSYAQRRTAKELAKYVPGATLVETAAVAAAPAASVAPPPAPAPAMTAAAAPPPAPAAPVAAAPVAAAPSAAPAQAGAVNSVPPGMSNVTVGGSELHVADSVQNTYARVGLALERAQLGTLSAHDDGAHTYTLNFSGTVETNAEGEHHWYSFVLHPFGGDKKTEQVTRQLLVRVAGDGAGAKVSVEGDTSDKLTADAARKVIEVLRDRLS